MILGEKSPEEVERTTLIDGLKEIESICEENKPKTTFNHLERVINKIHDIAKGALSKVVK